MSWLTAQLEKSVAEFEQRHGACPTRIEVFLWGNEFPAEIGGVTVEQSTPPLFRLSDSDGRASEYRLRIEA